jgi:hypothetical protein
VEKIACHPLSFLVGIEEADDTFGLLKRLDQSIQKQPVETTIGEANAILVMLEKGVHGTSSVVRHLEAYTVNVFFGHSQTLDLPGYQGRSPCLVSLACIGSPAAAVAVLIS